jgi:hypothetical protein
MSERRNRLVKSCLDMLDNLGLLRMPFEDESALLHRLALLNRSYLSIVNYAKYRPSFVNFQKVDEDEDEDLETFRCTESGFVVVILKNSRVISVSTGNGDINAKALRFLANSQNVVQDMATFLAPYADYGHRRCDECLQIKDFHMAHASERIAAGDYVAAYHTECLERSRQIVKPQNL